MAENADKPVSGCTFTEEDVFNHSQDVSEGKADPAMARHVQNCPRCQGFMSGFRQVSELVAPLRAEVPAPAPEPRMQQSITGFFFPETIGGFKILDRIGEGGMGQVWRAYDQSLERHVAIKVMKEELSKSTEFCERFIGEAKTVAKLNHPGIAGCPGRC